MLLLFESWTTTYKGEGRPLSAKARKGLVLCFERLKMPHKMKRMREMIEEIINLHNKFNFIEHTSNNDEEMIRKRETFSDADEVPVGRMEEKERIISMLQTDDSKCLIVFIYGFGGVGKTTLAQMVFNDDRTKHFFEIQAWVYVSVKFDVKIIGQSIISQLDKSSGPADTTLQAIRHRLRTIVEGQRFLIVLDDLWEENPDGLETLRTLLRGGKTGSKIIATTRSEKVAKLMNGSLRVELGALPDNYCWELFQAKAFPHGKVDTVRQLIGRQIVKKRRGMPLAAISLGCLCRTTNEWESIRDSDIWAEDGDDGPFIETKVLPSLKLSYQYMSYHLKLCFAYCAVFPKGCYIEKSSLIQQWIALGFLQHPGKSFTAEQAGERYFEDLREMSFLQDVARMSPTDTNISVNEIIDAEDLESLFILPLSQEPFEELQILRNDLQLQHFDEQTSDIWTYRWNNGIYSSKKFYKLAFQNMTAHAHPIFAWLWKSKIIPRINFFACLVLVDRLNTKVMLRRRNMPSQGNAHCVLCDAGVDEDIEHLFFGCSFSQDCWDKIGIQWNTDLSLYPRVAHARQQQNIPFFMEVVTIAAWELWKLRNDKVFNDGQV